MSQPLFAGLIIDEFDQAVEIGTIGNEPCYIVDDAGFKRHIASEHVDRQIWEHITALIKGNEGIIADQTVQMLGQEDLFTHAIIRQQLEKLDQQFEAMQKTGIPEEVKAYLGMMGFKVVIDLHGDVIKIQQPSAPSSEEE